MIYDLLTNIGNYRGMNRNLDKAIDYLMASDINTLPLGKTVIDGDMRSFAKEFACCPGVAYKISAESSCPNNST